MTSRNAGSSSLLSMALITVPFPGLSRGRWGNPRGRWEPGLPTAVSDREWDLYHHAVQTPPPDMWPKWSGYHSKKGDCSSNIPNKPALMSHCIPKSPRSDLRMTGFSHNKNMGPYSHIYNAYFKTTWCIWCFYNVFQQIRKIYISTFP